MTVLWDNLNRIYPSNGLMLNRSLRTKGGGGVTNTLPPTLSTSTGSKIPLAGEQGDPHPKHWCTSKIPPRLPYGLSGLFPLHACVVRLYCMAGPGHPNMEMENNKLAFCSGSAKKMGPGETGLRGLSVVDNSRVGDPEQKTKKIINTSSILSRRNFIRQVF